MSSYRKKINDIKLDSYEAVKAFYLRVTALANEMKKAGTSYHFQFRCGEISCVTESIEDFTKEAYGAKDFCLVSMQLMYFLPGKENLSVNYLGDLSITATNKVLLEDFVKRLDVEPCCGDAAPKSLVHNSVGNTIIVNGNGNVIANAGGVISGNEIENERGVSQPKAKQSGVKSFFSGVLQNIVSNVVWYLLGLIATAVVAYIVTQ